MDRHQLGAALGVDLGGRNRLISVTPRSAWSTYQVLGQTMSQKKKKKNLKRKVRKKEERAGLTAFGGVGTKVLGQKVQSVPMLSHAQMATAPGLPWRAMQGGQALPRTRGCQQLPHGGRM